MTDVEKEDELACIGLDITGWPTRSKARSTAATIFFQSSRLPSSSSSSSLQHEPGWIMSVLWAARRTRTRTSSGNMLYAKLQPWKCIRDGQRWFRGYSQSMGCASLYMHAGLSHPAPTIIIYNRGEYLPNKSWFVFSANKFFLCNPTSHPSNQPPIHRSIVWDAGPCS